MNDLFWLSDAQMAKLEPFFPKSHGKPRVERHYLHQSQWFALAELACGIWPAQDTLQPVEAMERERHLRSDASGTGRSRRPDRDPDD